MAASDDVPSPRKVDSPEGSSLELESGGVQVETTGAPATLGNADRDAIVDTVRRYVIAATIDPFHGKPVGDLAPLFTLPAVAALNGLDRVAALDEGVPKATGLVKVTSAPMILTALSDPMGGDQPRRHVAVHRRSRRPRRTGRYG